MLTPARLLILSLSLSFLSGCTVPWTAQPSGSLITPSHHDGALLVPTIAMPAFDGLISPPEWDDAATLNGTFTIADGGRADGQYPFTLRVGVTHDGLLLGITVHNGTRNPFNTETATYAEHVWFFFAMGAEGNLTRPSFGISAATFDRSTFTGRHFWNGVAWEGDPTPDGLRRTEDGTPSGGTWTMGSAGNGTLSFEVFTPRIPPQTIRNGLHLGPEATFRMVAVFMRQGDGSPETQSPDASGNLRSPHDAFPGDGYTPNGMLDPSTWLKLRIA